MTDKKKPPPKDEDEAQSQRFLDFAAELESAGDLSPIGDEEAFKKLVEKVAPVRKPRLG